MNSPEQFGENLDQLKAEIKMSKEIERRAEELENDPFAQAEIQRMMEENSTEIDEDETPEEKAKWDQIMRAALKRGLFLYHLEEELDEQRPTDN